MQPQGFILGLSNGAIRVNSNKSDVFLPIHYTMIQSTCKVIQQWLCLYQNQKSMYILKQAELLAYKNLVKILLLMIMNLSNNLQASGEMQQRKKLYLCVEIFGVK